MKQDWYNDNRKRFEAQTTISEGTPRKCKHYIERKSSMAIGCKHCGIGWLDHGRIKTENGKIIE